MKRENLLDCMEYLDGSLITAYAEAKHASNAACGKKAALPKWLLPAACLILIAVLIPTVFPRIGAALYGTGGASDRKYEARHTHFSSLREAEKVLGDGFPFSKLPDGDKTEIDLMVAEGGSPSVRASWETVSYRKENQTETVSMTIYLPAFTGNEPQPWLENPVTETYGETEVTYSVYGKGSHMDAENHVVTAEFRYGGNLYEFTYCSPISPEGAFTCLELMLGT